MISIVVKLHVCIPKILKSLSTIESLDLEHLSLTFPYQPRNLLLIKGQQADDVASLLIVEPRGVTQ